MKLIRALAAMGLAFALLVPAATAAHGQYTGGTTPTVGGDTRDRGDTGTHGTPGDPRVAGNTADPNGRATRVAGTQTYRGLAATGGDVLALTAIGGGLVVAGAVLARRRRHRQPA